MLSLLVSDLGDKANDMILEKLVRHLMLQALAALTNGDQAIAMEVYLVSAAVIDASNEAEQVYLKICGWLCNCQKVLNNNLLHLLRNCLLILAVQLQVKTRS